MPEAEKEARQKEIDDREDREGDELAAGGGLEAAQMLREAVHEKVYIYTVGGRWWNGEWL